MRDTQSHYDTQKSLWRAYRFLEKGTQSHCLRAQGHREGTQVIARLCKDIVRACLHCTGHTVIVKVIHSDCEGTESLWWHTKSIWGSHRVIIRATLTCHWVGTQSNMEGYAEALWGDTEFLWGHISHSEGYRVIVKVTWIILMVHKITEGHIELIW